MPAGLAMLCSQCPLIREAVTYMLSSRRGGSKNGGNWWAIAFTYMDLHRRTLAIVHWIGIWMRGNWLKTCVFLSHPPWTSRNPMWLSFSQLSQEHCQREDWAVYFYRFTEICKYRVAGVMLSHVWRAAGLSFPFWQRGVWSDKRSWYVCIILPGLWVCSLLRAEEALIAQVSKYLWEGSFLYTCPFAFWKGAAAILSWSILHGMAELLQLASHQSSAMQLVVGCIGLLEDYGPCNSQPASMYAWFIVKDCILQ